MAVYSLLHFPWAHAPQALPGTLSYGARTFLSLHLLLEMQPATVQLTLPARVGPDPSTYKHSV